MFGHSTFVAKPVRCQIESFLCDSIGSNVLTKGRNFWSFMLTLFADVGVDGFIPLMLDNRSSYLCGHRSTTTKSLWSNPIWESSSPKFLFHPILDSLDFIQCFLFSHWRSVLMCTTSHDDSEAIATVITESNFLMGSSEDFDDNIWNFDFCDLELRRIDHKNLRCHCSFVFGSCKKDTVSRDTKLLGKIVAETIGFPVGQGNFCDSKSTLWIEGNGRCDFINTEVSNT